MFEVGDYIVCGNNGICAIQNISTIDIPDVDPDRLYYILQPVYTKSSVVYIPVDNDKIVMRKVLTKEQVNELIDHIPQIDAIVEMNDKLREEKFKECMKNHKCEDWIRVIKTLYLRRMERLEKGQKVTATDARYMKAAEDNLYLEFSMALGIDRDEVESYIEKCIDGE
ncbi:MAG: CarD family transcriptional regulator [Lachnospiraceae bacterium]|nr:CarD family transcriptional regulator [Lachnospiraceae bacterium]